MKKEEPIQFTQKMNINHKKIISNIRNKLEMNKIFSNRKIIISNNKRKNTTNNKIKNKNDINQKENCKEEIKNQDVTINKYKNKRKAKKNDIKNNTDKMNKININNKTMDQYILPFDISLKKYQTSTLNKSNYKIKTKNNRKSTLTRINNKENQEIINKQKYDINTNILFRNAIDISKEHISKKKDCYFLNNDVNKNNGNESKIYNNSNNINLYSNKNILNKGINSKIKKNNNTSSFLQNIFNSPSPNHSKSIIIQNSFTQQSNLEYKRKNLITNENMIKISKKLNNSGSLSNSFNNLLSSNPQNLFNSLNSSTPNNCFKNNNIKTIDNFNLKKIGKSYLKKKINKNNKNEKIENEKKLDLNEVEKDIYQFIQKKKENKKIYLNKICLSLNQIRSSFELKQKEYFMSDNEKLNNYLNSPIKYKEKKQTENHHYFINDMINKKNIITKKSKEKLKGDLLNKKFHKNNNYSKYNNNTINVKKDIKKGKKDISIQSENKIIKKRNEKNKNVLMRKNINYNSTENNNINVFNSISIYKTIQINPFEINRNTYSGSKSNLNCTKKLNNNIHMQINKRRVNSIDFDIIKNGNKFKIRDKKEKNNIEFNNLTVKKVYKNKTNILFNENKIKYIRSPCIKKKEKINDEKSNNKDNSEIELEEENLIPDSTQYTNNNISKINDKMKSHFLNVIIKRKENLKLKSIPKISLYSFFDNPNILNKIVDFCDCDTLNKLCLFNRQYYNNLKPIIYERIKLKVHKINKDNNYLNNIIKKSILICTPLSKLSPVMLQKKYIDLLYEINEKNDLEIKKDLLRTLPDDISFQYGKENYNKLYHILSAYSNYNKNIGYTQGLNFLAAHCMYIYKNEIEAFVFLDGLVTKFKLENLFGIKNNELNKKLKEIECIVNKWCPEVNKHLQKIFLNYDFFTCKWMITLFSNNIKLKYLFQLWDYMIIFGWKFFKCFIIAVIKFNEKKILNSTLETITKIMNDILKTQEFENNFSNIINETFLYIIKENVI